MKLTTKFGIVASIVCLQCTQANATEVALVGIFPGKAVLSVDGRPPKTIAPGQSIGEVKLISIERDAVIIEAGGKRDRIEMGAQSFAVGAPQDPSGSGQSVTLVADPNGHFYKQGRINSASVTFLVDTGATSIAMGPIVAEQAGIDYKAGRMSMVGTANGVAPVYAVTIEKVTLGDLVLRNVEAVVLMQDMPSVLLGMSFLNRVTMARDGTTMVLKRRY